MSLRRSSNTKYNKVYKNKAPPELKGKNILGNLYVAPPEL
jgi:hypothetical protein